MTRFARWLVRYPVLFVAANLLVTAVLGVYALRIRIESSLESVLPAGDPEVEYYTRVRATFGSDDVGVVGIRADDIFAPATVEKIARVTDALGRISGVERVLSIANAVDPAEDVFKPPRLLPSIPPSSVEVQELKQKLRSTPLYGKNLVADDFKGAAINVFFRNLTDAEYLDLGIDDQIRDVLAGESGPERFFYTGAAHVKQAAVELMRRDLFRFTPIALLVILAVLWLSFWTVRGVVLPVVSVVMALVWTLGALVLDGKALTRLGQHAYASRAKILAGAAVLCVVGLLGALAIRVDSDFLYYFDEKSEVRTDTETINREIVGSNPFYIVIEGPSPGFLKRWEVLREIKDLQRFLAGLPGITSSVSLVDYMELLESGLNRRGAGDLVIDEEGNIVPAPKPRSFLEEPKNLEPVLSMIATSPATFKSVVTEDFGETNILVRTNLSGSRRIEETLARIRSWIGAHFPAELRVHLTGNLVLLSGTESDIVAGQIKSLSLALGIIFVVLALMFLSVRIGFFAILPNVVPIVLFFGTMGWLGILLNLGTSLIAAIALGIAVDSTIHYMARLHLELRGETDQVAGLVRTVRTVGVPIVYTTVALFRGVLTFAFASFVPIQNFGILTAFTMAAALGANLVLLPALLATTKVITLWDLVGVKLGQEPARTIPLFAGLRPGQARIVVLMGELKRFAPGEMVVRRGELGDEMYVIIRGRAEVWAGDGQERRRVAEHRRGDVFGEMGLVRPP